MTVSSEDLLLEAATMENAEWEDRCAVLRTLPSTATLPALVACMRDPAIMRDLASISDVDRTIFRVASLTFDLIRVDPGDPSSLLVEPAVVQVAEAFGPLLGSWYGQDRWRGDFVPKASAFSLVMEFALAVGAPQKSQLHAPFRKAAQEISDVVL